MCLAVFAIGQHDRFPFVLAANRDELFARPAAPLGWWPTRKGRPAVLAGRDLTAGGTWLGLSRAGRVGLLTNIRAGISPPGEGPSRGAIVTRWLEGNVSVEELAAELMGKPYAGFNLIAADLSRGQCHWLHSRAPEPLPVRPGLYGLSNGWLDEPWPKVVHLRERVIETLADADADAGRLTDKLLDALRDGHRYADEHLPETGVPVETERLLSAIFIESPDGRYGTRCSTVVVCERTDGGTVATHVTERTYDSRGRAAGDQRVTVDGWVDGPR